MHIERPPNASSYVFRHLNLHFWISILVNLFLTCTLNPRSIWGASRSMISSTRGVPEDEGEVEEEGEALPEARRCEAAGVDEVVRQAPVAEERQTTRMCHSTMLQ